MYDWPEAQPATDAFWAVMRDALEAEGVAAPATVSRPEDLSAPWRDPGLVLGQTCGLPYVSGRCGGAVPVARPVYAVEGAGDGTYCSALICRAQDPRELAGFRGARAAINEIGSQSGCNALKDAFLQADLADGPLFGDVVMSGAHRASALAVAAGDADIAAIDAVAWAMFAAFEPEAHANLRVLAWTRPMPALPFITGPETAPRLAELIRALERACAANEGPFLPVAIRPATDADYDPIREMARQTAETALG